MWKIPEALWEDPEIRKTVEGECERQETHLELIASENFVSPAALAAMGSPLNNKYAEGYPGKRYYGGCEFVDVTENLARERAKALFGAPPNGAARRSPRGEPRALGRPSGARHGEPASRSIASAISSHSVSSRASCQVSSPCRATLSFSASLASSV